MVNSSRIYIHPGDVPVIEILESDCDGRIPDSVMNGKRIMQKAPRDHKRYWREMVATYLRNELDLRPDLPSDTIFSLKFPASYELYGGMRDSGAYDYYLFGFNTDGTREKFDSPANFVLHAKWLACGRARGACGCKPCTGTAQIEISKGLTLGGAKVKQPSDESITARSRNRRLSESGTDGRNATGASSVKRRAHPKGTYLRGSSRN